jgi:2-polyprenyl-6-methoxyphenol hydroxylase-like FAD-dependent oxidoreductase
VVAALAPELIEPGVFWETWGRGVRFGFVDIGEGRAYWFVSESVAEAAQPPESPKRSFLRRFTDWHDPIARIIEATPEEAITRTLVYDRKPIDRWGEGRITLLGDAAHPMTPNLGQGASQALEDAAVLGKTAREHGEPEPLLREYERRRIKRANTIVRRSWQTGRVAQARNPLVCAVRNAALRVTPARIQKSQQQRLLRFDP